MVRAYRPKASVEIHAIRYTTLDLNGKTNEREVREFAGRALVDIITAGDGILYINTNHGTTELRLGQWLIRKADGERYPCSHENFVERWQAIDPDPED